MPAPMRHLPVILLLTALTHATAHESPSHTLEQLNKHIAEKPSPELLFQRAMAHQALGNTNQAAADLHAATTARPNELGWQLARCRVELSANRPAKALAIASKSLRLAKNADLRAQVHILRAEAYHATGKSKPSLHACQLAFKEVPKGEVSWYLLRSDNQRKLGRFEPRIRGLRAGLKHYPGSILKSHLAEAMIDAGQHSEALAIIEKEIPTLRWKSAWLIRRARAYQGISRLTDAQADLQVAMDEINTRLNPAKPDPLLLADKARIFLLSGDHASAAATTKLMRKHRAPHWLIKNIEDELPGK